MSTRVRFALLPIALILALLLSQVVSSASANEVVSLAIKGPVTPAMVSYFERGIAEAESTGAVAVIIQLDTPGGQVNLMLEIVQHIRSSSVPVIVFIGPRGAQAASAGAVITAAAHIAAMAPETVIGAASPIDASGQDLGETIERKAMEDLKATMRSLVERRGEDAVKVAEEMIEEARAIHANEAIEIGLIDIVAEDVPSVLDELDGFTVVIQNQEIELELSDIPLREIPLNPLEQILHTVVNPAIITILMAIGVQAVLIELSSPGGWIAGFVGVVCLILGLYGLGVLPINWLGLGLVITAFVLFFMEIKAPTHGALTVAGVATLIAGYLLMFNYPGSPQFARVPVPLVVAIAVMTGGFFAFVLAKALTARTKQPVTGKEGLVGRLAEVRTPLDPGGTVFLLGERWRAETLSGEHVEAGAKVKVTAVNGFSLTVEKVDSP